MIIQCSVHVHVYCLGLFLLPFPQVKKPSLLKKYDEEIEGEKRHSFALGELLVIV